jgi:hypothetical protein
MGAGAIAQSATKNTKASSTKTTSKTTTTAKATAGVKAKTSNPAIEVSSVNLSSMLKTMDSSAANKPDTLQAPKQ